MICVICVLLIVMLCLILFLLVKCSCIWLGWIFKWCLCSVVSLYELFLCVYFVLLICVSVVLSKCMIVVMILLCGMFGNVRLCVMCVWMCGSVCVNVVICVYLFVLWVVCYCGW